MNKHSNKELYFGIDDGHDSIKSCNNDQELIIPSKIISGKKIMLDNITGEQKTSVYVINNNSYTIANSLLNSSDSSFIDTRLDGYPFSDINVALVHHSLIKSNAQGKINIATGLPFNRFFKDGKLNKNLIAKKIQAFEKANITSNMDINYQIINHKVYAEGVSAYYDISLNDDGTDNTFVKDAINNKNVVIVDIGGRTTDIVTINADSIDFERSCTKDIGGLQVKDKIKSYVQSITNTYNIPDNLVKNILEDENLFQKYRKEYDLPEDLVNKAKIDLCNEIKYTIHKTIHNTVDIAFIAFVGGGSILLKEELKSLFDNKFIKFVKNPTFSNARGMRKILTRSLSEAENEEK